MSIDTKRARALDAPYLRALAEVIEDDARRLQQALAHAYHEQARTAAAVSGTSTVATLTGAAAGGCLSLAARLHRLAAELDGGLS